MVHQLALYKLQSGVTDEVLDDMIRRTRSTLLKVPEVMAVRSGRKIDPQCEWPFFVGLDFESRAKQRIFMDDGAWHKFQNDIIRPHTTEKLVLDYELDPGKNVKYS
jgi:hypothetical protein